MIRFQRGLGLGCALLAALAPSACDDERLADGDAGSAGSSTAGSGGSGSHADSSAGTGGTAGSSSQDAASDVVADASAEGSAGDAGQSSDSGADADAADADDAADAMATLMPDFGLYDLNPNSQSYQALVSPKDYSGKISAWYFGHAT